MAIPGRGRSLMAALLWLALATAPTHAGAPGSAVVADLEGEPLLISEVADHYCHDLDFPRLHCFRTPDALEAAVGAVPDAASPEGQDATLAAPAGTWVTVYRDSGFLGSYAYLSRNYDNLGDIGWNDTISSYRVQASFGGSFHQHADGAGWAYRWYAFEQNAWVGAAYNDQFSSFYRS